MSCSSKKYVLTGKTSQNKRLVQLVTKLKVEDKINNKPMILVNEKVMSKKELKKLTFSNSDILEISVIEKGKKEMVEIYGENSLNGIIMIEIKPPSKKISKKNILFIVDGKTVTAAIAEKLDKDKIDEITIIKGKKSVSKYTDKKYDGIIIIKLKKK